jgi:pimeloyl-ACP methyl ester carboxylesterase
MKKRNYVYLAAGAFLLLGRYITGRLVSGGWGKPLQWPRTNQHRRINCPSNNTWHARFDGPADAPPLVFIHGINANHRQWYYQRQYFNKSHRLIFLGMPLHGKNANGYKLDIPTLAADLSFVFAQLHLSGAVVYGHSMGGMVLLQYGVLHLNPVRVKGMVVHGASYTNPLLTAPLTSWLALLQRPLVVPVLNFYKRLRRVFNVLSYLNFFNGTGLLGLRYLLFTGTQTAEQLIYVSAMAPTNDAGAVAESLLQLMRYNVSRELGKINIPVLLISGLRDRLSAVSCNLYMHRYLPQAQLKLIPAGHQGMVENHRQVNAALAEFMQQVQ